MIYEAGVVNEFITAGTHTGPFVSPQDEIPATGRRINYHVCEVWEVKDGKLIKLRNYFDTTTILYQLGMIST